jgi:hypothetical protein
MRETLFDVFWRAMIFLKAAPVVGRAGYRKCAFALKSKERDYGMVDS